MTSYYNVHTANQYGVLDSSDESGDETRVRKLEDLKRVTAERETTEKVKTEKSEFRRGRRENAAGTVTPTRGGGDRGRGSGRGRGGGERGRGAGRGGAGRGEDRGMRASNARERFPNEEPAEENQNAGGGGGDWNAESWGGDTWGNDSGNWDEGDKSPIGEESNFHGRERGRGGRGRRGEDRGRRGREFDRRSGTGRGTEMKKGGGAGHNWGGMDVTSGEMNEGFNSPNENQNDNSPERGDQEGQVEERRERRPRRDPSGEKVISLDQLRADQDNERKALPTRDSERRQRPMTEDELQKEGFKVPDMKAVKDVGTLRRETNEDAGVRSGRGGVTMDLYTYADKQGVDLFKHSRGGARGGRGGARGGAKSNEDRPRPEPVIELSDPAQFPCL